MTHKGAWNMLRKLERAGDSGTNLLLPLAGLIFIALVSGAALIAMLVVQTDTNVSRYMHAVLEGALHREVESIGETAHTTALWDDAVANLYGELNTSWALTNIAYPIHSYIIDDRGRTLYARRGNDQMEAPLDEVAPEAVKYLLKKLPKSLAAAKRMKTGVSFLASYQGRPVAVGAMAIIPLQGTQRLKTDRLRYLVYARELDQTVLTKWQKAFRIKRVQWQRSVPDANSYIGVDTVSGRHLGYITWEPVHAGSKAMRGIMPLALVATILFAGMSAWLIRLIDRSGRALAAGKLAAQLAATEADRARVEAEIALNEAEKAKRQMAYVAGQKMEEQALHAHGLRKTSHGVADTLNSATASLVRDLLETANDLERSADITLNTIREQEQQARTVRDRSQDTAAGVHAITGFINGLAVSIGDIRRETETSRQVVITASSRSTAARENNDNLLHQVSSISDAARLIADIAAQTNMLALNATIEAARAGPAGRGFAVVANEVMALARQTAQTTKDIHSRIEGIESAARSTVDMVDAMHGIFDELVQSTATCVTAVERQQVTTREMHSSSHAVGANAETANQAISAITQSLSSVAETANATRQIGANVRLRAEELRQRLEQVVTRLKAA